MAMKSVDSTTRFPHGARHSRMVTPWVLEFVNSPQRLTLPPRSQAPIIQRSQGALAIQIAPAALALESNALVTDATRITNAIPTNVPAMWETIRAFKATGNALRLRRRSGLGQLLRPRHRRLS